ncbi:FAD-binding oxidoreductase [soil metagenome]
MTEEIVIIGGGVMGTSIAYHLAKRGARVTLIERDQLAAQASGASAGGVRQNGRDPREMPLAIAAIKRWHTLEDELEADIEFRMGGQMLVTEHRDDIPNIHKIIADQRALGLTLEYVEDPYLHKLAPGLSPTISAGLYTADDGQASAPLTTNAFGAAAERAGAKILTGTTVTKIVHSGGRITGLETTSGPIACDWLMLAAGAWSPELARQIELELPIKTMALQMLATAPAPHMLDQTVGAIGRHLSLKQVPSGSFVIGGGWPGDADLETRVGTTRMDSIRGNIEHATAIFPALKMLPLQRFWIGIEALAYDGVPIMGAIPGLSNATLATAFSGHGFALSPIIGQLLSELIIDGSPSISLDAFAVDRFANLPDPLVWPEDQAG